MQLSTTKSKCCRNLTARFMEVCLPCDDLYIRSVVTQRPSYDCSRYERLNTNVEAALAALLSCEIEYHLESRTLREELKRRFDWMLNRAFCSIDVANDGFINFSSLLNFFRINGYNPTETEVIAVVRRLDCDADQRINYEEFRMLFGDDCAVTSSQHLTSSMLSPTMSALKGSSPMRRKQSSPRRVAFEETKSAKDSPRASQHEFPQARAGTSSRNSPLRSKSPRKFSQEMFQQSKMSVI